MRVFRTKPFTRFARKARLSDGVLRDAVGRAERGLIDADLGGGVIKQRIARPGSGKSGGFRTIVLFQASTLSFFVHGFAKSERANIGTDELAAFKLLAERLLTYDDAALAAAVVAGVLTEVTDDDEPIS